MPITILSPYSGKPVKVRDQDVGRAIRDEEGRIFYIVNDEGGDIYAAMTRKGSEKDLARYQKMVSGSAATHETAKENVLAIHDATGKKRRNPIGILMLLVIVAAVIAGAYVYFVRPDLIPGLNNPPANNEQTPGSSPDDPEQEGDASQLPPIPNPAPNVDHVSQPDTPENNEGLSWADTLAFAHTPSTYASVQECLTFFGIAYAPEPLAEPTWRPGHPATSAVPTNIEDRFADYRVLDSGLRVHSSKLGDGPLAVAGSYVEVRFAVYDMDDRVLVGDESQGFVLMQGQAIRALEEGIAGMRPGGQRQLMVPRGHSQLGQLPGLDALPRGAFQIDLELTRVRRGVSTLTEATGLGEPAMPGDEIELTYEAWVEGAIEPYDSSDLRSQPMRVTLGANAVITGLEAGLRGIREGETRLLTIPPYLAYGSEGAAGGLIPPDAVINYRITAQAIRRPDAAAQQR